MSGVPQLVIQKASAILAELEKRRHKLGAPNANQLPATHPSIQLSMFQVHDPVLEEIKIELDALDVNRLSPVEALIKLNEFKQKLNKTLTG
jgi:DNA mismatch repair protein MutS